ASPRDREVVPAGGESSSLGTLRDLAEGTEPSCREPITGTIARSGRISCRLLPFLWAEVRQHLPPRGKRVAWARRRQRGAEGAEPGRPGDPGPCPGMFKNTFQSGFLSVLYSIGSKPLQIWDKKVRNGHIKRITDNDIQSLVLEIEGTNVSTTYITCPADPKKTLGIKLPFLVMIIKNLKKYFTFEVQVLDDKNVRRRFRASNYQSTTRVKPFICTMPMRLDDGWNQIQFNLSDFTRRAYGTNYIETLRVQIHANCRIRRVYFSDRLYSEDELPAEFKLYLPVQNKAKQ
ncbi:cilia and flagella associated protein 20, partial [Chelydra serpentina]